MTYPQTVDYLYSRLPMFTRIGASAFKKDLTNTIALCDALNNPQNKYKTIHVGGTNGKGSTSHMLAAIFQKAGYKTGLYTSPHLKDFRERIRVNGKMVSKSFVTKFVKEHQTLISAIEPSFFEVTVAMAFSYFEQQQVDIAIIEVGLGGRLDSTNIIQPELAVITNISLDHTNMLGNTFAEIAFEKAGIIKKNTPVIIGEHHPETDPVFIKKATEQNANLIFAQDDLIVTNIAKNVDTLKVDVIQKDQTLFKNLALDLTGGYQLKNILTVIEASLQLKKLGYNLTDKAILDALKSVKKLTGLQGRWQTLHKKPLTICDTGHNKAGIAEVVENIKQTPYENLHMVIGMVKDKDINAVLALLPSQARYYFCQPQLERALPAAELKEQALQYQLRGEAFTSVADALQTAQNAANEKDLIFIGGSTFVVAEII
ncbi:bifunctional folylpolyglutamate synthase/dihydrofolate synthase [Nubsella zeaxanthinifaciens]|jgi:dihydrofolate synthase/folylpolyglutamate synthase|uniref:bifunctional folylpolyglutamate synthase/dihydrofolate synthase n=1 Tax=Nubsella zeaxanthinifaciens TaxID=392412 RepID=UPI000DE39B8B|nr:folylpolyglutamate synthase/dihydrofolate synthase family protein [Nubsella zeaxanthinifaciens]